MKILFTLRYYPVYGGGEAVTLKLADSFVKHGHEVYIIYLWDSESSRVIINNNIKAYKIPNGHEPVGRDEINSNDFKIMKKFLGDVIRKENIDIIINQWWPEKVIYQANKHKASIIKCHHSAVVVDSKRKSQLIKMVGAKIYKNLLRIYLFRKYRTIMKYSDKLVLLNEKYVEDIIWILGEGVRNQILAIPNPSKYDSYLNLDSVEKKKNVLFVGRFAPEKRIEIIIDAWKNNENYIVNNDWHLRLLGSGELFQKIEQIVKYRECKNVELCGHIDPLKEYQEASILLMTSSYEGVPMVIVEAMQNGCVPLVMNTFSACEEIIQNNLNGIVSLDSQADFDNKLLLLMKNEKYRKKMMYSAIESSKKYSIENIYDKWEKLLSTVVSRSKNE